MTRCTDCGKDLTASELKDQEDPDEPYCEDCADALADKGLAIMMMNGDADYDDEHVEEHL